MRDQGEPGRKELSGRTWEEGQKREKGRKRAGDVEEGTERDDYLMNEEGPEKVRDDLWRTLRGSDGLQWSLERRA